MSSTPIKYTTKELNYLYVPPTSQTILKYLSDST